MGLVVDGDAKGGQAQRLRFTNGLASVLQAVASLIDIQVVGFAIGQEHEQTAVFTATGKLQRCVAYRRPHARVIAWANRPHTGSAGFVPGFRKSLEMLQAHMAAPHRTEAPHCKRVTHGTECFTKHVQCIADHVDDTFSRCGVGIGGKRQVSHQQRSQTALAECPTGIDGRRISVPATGALLVSAVAYPGVQIQIVAAFLAVLGSGCVAQGLQLAPNLPRRELQCHAGLEARSLARAHHLHRAVCRHKSVLAIVPLGQQQPGAHGHIVGAGARQVQVKPDTAGECLSVRRDGQRIHVIGSAVGVAVVFVIGAAIDVDMLAPGHQSTAVKR